MNQSKTYINLAIVAALVALAAFFLIPRNAPGPNPPDGPDVPPLANAQLNPPLTWNGWVVPMGVQLGVVIVLGLGLMLLAAQQFEKAE